MRISVRNCNILKFLQDVEFLLRQKQQQQQEQQQHTWVCETYIYMYM